MAEYIVSARKYRPDSFESLLGQDNISQTLKNSIARQKLAHAYLFCGPRGVGKTSTARIFAKTINCQNLTENREPCGSCESCVSFEQGRSYCIHEMDAASNNSVDEIKTLIEQVYIPPQVGRYSVYIVDEVHMLSSAAFNAFLKTLEEPPAHAIFILATTEKHKIPATILSRCQTFDFKRIDLSDIVANIKAIAEKEKIQIDEEAMHVIALKSDGAMRDALSIFDQMVAFCGDNISYEAVLKNLNVLSYEYSFILLDYFLQGNYAQALLLLDEVLSKGFNALYFISSLSAHLRNLLVAKSLESRTLLELPESLQKRYCEQAESLSLAFIYEALNICASAEASYKQSINPRLSIELALIKLCFIIKPEDKPMELNRLEPLQQQKSAETPALVEASSVVKRAAVQKKNIQESEAQKENLQEAAVQKQNIQVSEAQKESLQELEVAKADSKEELKTRRVRKTLKTTILASEQRNEAQEGLSAVNPEYENKIPDDELVREKWKELAGFYVKRPRLSTAISEAVLELSVVDDKKRIIFMVANQAQQQWIQEYLLRELQTKLCELLKTTAILLLVELLPQEEVVHKHMTQRERAIAIIETNPQVKELVEDLKLDA